MAYRIVRGIVLLGLAVSLRAEPCYDRTTQPYFFVADSHLHAQPFSGPALDHQTLMSYLADVGVRYATLYGIGQRRIENWDCSQHFNCVGPTPIRPTMTNDFVNASNLAGHPQDRVHLTLSMTFPDLRHPDTILPRMHQLDDAFPGFFHWMGEVNLVKQALFDDGHQPATRQNIEDWAPFMAELRRRHMPLSLHADLGNDADPTHYLPLMEYVLERYPDNVIVWMHLGVSRELRNIDPAKHTAILSRLMDRYPNLWLDISWRVLYDNYFRNDDRRPYYVDLLNRYSSRVLTGTDLVASAYTTAGDYHRLLAVNSDINQYLNDTAFRDIALGQSYFNLLSLDEDAPDICPRSS